MPGVYLRPGGSGRYLRPGGLGVYLRPGDSSGTTVVSFRRSVYARLSVDASLAVLVGSRIWSRWPRQSWKPATDGPCLTWSVVSRDFGSHLDGVDGTADAIVELSAWAARKADALAIADLFRAWVSANPGQYSGVTWDEVVWSDRTVSEWDPVDGTDVRVYQVATTLNILHRTDGT